jgi:hypothetical protein
MLHCELEAWTDATPKHPTVTLVARAEHTGERLMLMMFARPKGPPTHGEGSHPCCNVNV